MPDLNVGIKVSATDDTEDGLAAAKESIKTFQTAAEEAGRSFVEGASDVKGASDDVADSVDHVSNAAIENGKAIREASRDYKLMNIEQMQYNQILQMTGSTCIQWGSTLQGQHNLVKEAINNFVVSLDKATFGFSTYVGAGVQVLGMGVEVYAQISRMAIVWGTHTAAVAVNATAELADAAAAEVDTAAQWSLNAALAANPIGAIAIGIGVAAVAIGATVAAVSSYNTAQEAMNQKIDEMSDKIILLKAHLKDLYAGENDDVREIMAKRDDEQKQLVAMGKEYEAARQIGQQARVDELDGLMRVKIANIELFDQMEINARKAGPNIIELGKDWADLQKEMSNKYFAMLDPKDYWMARQGKADIERMKKEAHDWGVAVADAWAQGVKDGAYSAENQKIMEDAEKKMGEGLGPAHSPPAVGPLREVDRWGENVIAAFGGGMVSGISGVESNLAREIELRIAPQLLKGGSSTVNNESRSSTTIINHNTFNLSGVNEDDLARAVLRKLSNVLG
jgi:hypothetical protein